MTDNNEVQAGQDQLEPQGAGESAHPSQAGPDNPAVQNPPPQGQADRPAGPDQDQQAAEAQSDQAPTDEAVVEETPIDKAVLVGTVEAILFASDSPLPAARIAQVAQFPQKMVRQAIGLLNERYQQCGSAFGIEQIAGGFQLLTLGQYNDVLGRLLKARSDSKLSQAAMETLAIIAYRQPIIRADVESIRGVACGEVIRSLMERNMVKIIGRAEVVGRPMLYGTTKRFLEVFGLASLEDLPRVEELRGGADKMPVRQAPAPAPQPTPGPESAPSTAPAAETQEHTG